MMQHTAVISVLLTLSMPVWARLPKESRPDAGLIFKGMSTIERGPRGFGMDFYLQRPCTSAVDNCEPHIRIDYYGIHGTYNLIIVGNYGLYKDMGKANLDSIKSAPADSQMVEDGKTGVSPVFAIAPDSLRKCVGNVYIIKTGVDPRRTVYFIAKIKILSFTVRDSARHEVDMGFLWACNISGQRDLTTVGLDTFNLETPTVMSFDQRVERLRAGLGGRGKYGGFLVLQRGRGTGNGVLVGELRRPGRALDLTGRQR